MKGVKSQKRKNEKVLGLIPAKGGSVRFFKKNVAILEGRTLLECAVDVGNQCGLIDSIVVSSELEEILASARQLGVRALARPNRLARDPAGISDVAIHVIETLRNEGLNFDTLVILPPTSPLRRPEDVQSAMRKFVECGRENVMSVSRFTHTPFAAFKNGDADLLEPYFPEYFGKRSGDLPVAFRPNGAVHIVDVANLLRTGSYTSPPLFGVEMPIERSVDVDTPDDLEFARFLLGKNANQRIE